MWGDFLGIIEVLFVYKECGENQPPYQTMSGGLGSGGAGVVFSCDHGACATRPRRGMAVGGSAHSCTSNF